ncbi:putative sodium-dependent multivitamin transporter-like protein, partial [Dinothrombium tinctorium]
MATVTTTLSFWDYFVFGLMLLISALIGIYHHFSGNKQRTTKTYLLGDHKMSVFPVAISLMATAFVFLPVFFQMKATSAYQYLELRFSSYVRTTASLVFAIQMILYMGIVLYAPALALSAVTGISKWWSIISVGLVCTFYCTAGGIKAVLWTDVFQSFLMFASMILIIIKGTIDVGGIDIVWKRAMEGNRIQFFNFDADPTVRHTVWSLAIGGIFIYVSLYGVNQTQVQRCLTVRSLRDAK